jgi:tetratricopeptide (TPR) repeat protein
MNKLCLTSLAHLTALILACLVWPIPRAEASMAQDLFREGSSAYQAGNYVVAAGCFRQALALEPASGTLQNLGNAEWQQGRYGPAILAWEQALWLNPFNDAARNNLRFARRAAQLESPQLKWHEVVSTWLPAPAWAWLAGISLWGAVGLVLLPGILRWRKLAWQQAVAATGFAVFLLTVPAHFGVHTRAGLGFILQKDTPLKLTPTQQAQSITLLPAGEPARVLRAKGKFLLVRTNHSRGWIQRDQLGLTSPSKAHGHSEPGANESLGTERDLAETGLNRSDL